MKEFEGLNATVAGISKDSVKSHNNFITKHDLGVELLSDPDHVAMKKYGVWRMKKLYGREFMGVVRTTFLIDPKGNISHIWKNVRVKGHAEAVRRLLIEAAG